MSIWYESSPPSFFVSSTMAFMIVPAPAKIRGVPEARGDLELIFAVTAVLLAVVALEGDAVQIVDETRL